MDHLDKRHPRPDRAPVPRARRGRRDAQHGLRRGRRDDPRRHPGRQERRAVLRDDAGRRSAGSRRSTCATRPRSRSRTRPPRPANVTHRYLMVSYPQKVDALTRILEVENFEGMIVFVRTKNETETLAEKLRARGFSATAINGDIVQAQRERTIDELRDGKLDILVATDVAARGLDVDRISHVVNYDIPTDPESYVHRTGRTGRAGRSGDAISFVTPRERVPAQVHREDHASAADPDAAADRRGRQRHAARALRRRDHRGPVVDRAARVLPRRGLPLRPRAQRPGRRRGRGPRGRPPGRRCRCCSSPSPSDPPAASARPRATAAVVPTDQSDPSGAPRAGPGTRPWRRTGSRSASATRSSRVRSSARWPTRAVSTAETSGTSRSDPTSPWSSCPPSCRPGPRRRWRRPASPAS